MASRSSGVRAVGALFSGRLGRAVAALTTITFTVTSGAGLFAPVAFAGDLPRVVVVPLVPIYDGLPHTTSDKTTELLGNELNNSEMLQYVKLKAGEAAPAPVAEAPSAGKGATKDVVALTEARERVGKADDYIRKLKFKEATGELEKAITLFEGQHAFIDFHELTEAYLNLAVAYIRLGQDSEGEKLLKTVARLDPDTKLDTEKYPPVFINTYERMAKKVKKAKRGAIELETPPGAQVFLDGKEVGKAPVKIKEVVKGVHYLHVNPPGGAVWADRVDVGEDSVKVKPDIGGGSIAAPTGPMGELAALLTANTLNDQVLQKALAVAAENQADYVVLGGVHKDGDEIVVSTHMLKVQTKKFTLLQKVKFDGEMLGAGIEIYKVGADITNKVDVFGEAESLPTKVAKDAIGTPKAAGVAEVAAATPVSELPREPAQRPVVARATDTTAKPDRRPLAGEGLEERPAKSGDEGTQMIAADDRPRNVDTRKITARPAGDGDQAIASEVPVDEQDKDKKSSSSAAWIWVVAGAVVLGGGAAGGFYYFNQQSKPVTGTASVTW